MRLRVFRDTLDAVKMKLKLVCALSAVFATFVAFGQSTNRPLPSIHLPIGNRALNEIVPGQLLIKIRRSRGGGPSVKNVRGLPAGSKLLTDMGHMGWTLWSIPTSVDPRTAAFAVTADPNVAYAEPVNKISILINDPNDLDWGVTETGATDPELFSDGTSSTDSFVRLWHLDDDNALAAWSDFPGVYYTSSTKPLNAPMIAIIDTGCDPSHPDFMNAGAISSNTALGGQLNYALSKHFAFGAADGGSWVDDNGHGTHVTGLALAAANNGGVNNHGVPGIGYNAQGMILKVVAANGGGSDSDAAAAMFYAADNGADIISLSLGTTNYSQIFQDATTYAWQKGCLVVAAGNENGNGGGNLGPIYPAACSAALGVTADAPGYLSADDYYAGYGAYVAMGAPGGDVIVASDFSSYYIQYVWSTTPMGHFYLFDNPNGNPPSITQEYCYLAGTSMATPQVAGAAALYYGKFGLRAGQGHVNIRTYRALEQTAYGAAGAPNGGWEPTQGYGCLDAQALLLDYNARGAAIGGIEGIVYDGGTPVPNVQVRAQADGSQVYFSTTTLADGTYRFDGMPPGTYTVRAAPFSHMKTKRVLVMLGSDAGGTDFWAEGNPFDTTPPVVPIFTVNSVNASSVTLSQWGYDPDDGIDSIMIRIGTTVGGTDVYPDTQLVAESTNVTITGLTLQPSTNYHLRATYTNGAGLTTVIDRQISFGSATVTGTITLQQYTGPMVPVTVEVRTHGSLNDLQTWTVTPASSGTFSFAAPPPGNYDFAFKASHWLKKLVSNVVVTGSGASGLAPSLFNGDVNGDNTVSLADFGQLRAAFGSSSGSSNWNPNADLNGDGTVSLGDFAILRGNFGRSGDQ